MSALQLNNFVLARRLLKQLETFGLNPYDWQIRRKHHTSLEPVRLNLHLNKKGSIELQHRDDAGFKMKAEFSNTTQGLRMSTLRVVSL